MDTNTSEPTQPQKPTNGMRKMNIGFNPDYRKDVDAIKRWAADIYDWLEATVGMNITKIEDPLVKSDAGRLASIAYTQLESFQMLAVQAVTYTEDSKEFTKPFDKLLVISDEDQPTNGELEMTVQFNIGGKEEVNHIKKEAAYMYDRLTVESIVRNRMITDIHNKAVKPGATGTSNLNDSILIERKCHMAIKKVMDALEHLSLFRAYAVKAVTRS